MPDRIEEKLRTLQLDVDRVGLADSGAVRRRGEQRTRSQVLAAGLAVVAVVAGVVGVAGGELLDAASLAARRRLTIPFVKSVLRA